MTPARSIEFECRRCLGYDGKEKRADCDSKTCDLNNQSLRHLELIRAHCLKCVPELSVLGVKNCDGKVGYNGQGVCYLHCYRFGKNLKYRGGNPPMSPLRAKLLKRMQGKKSLQKISAL